MWPARAKVRPRHEKLAPLGEQIRSAVSTFDLAAYQMGEAHFGNFRAEAGLLTRVTSSQIAG